MTAFLIPMLGATSGFIVGALIAYAAGGNAYAIGIPCAVFGALGLMIFAGARA